MGTCCLCGVMSLIPLHHVHNHCKTKGVTSYAQEGFWCGMWCEECCQREGLLW